MRCTSLIKLVFFVTLIPPLLLGCDSPEQKEAKYIKSGNFLFDKGDYEKARLEYKNAVKLKPTAAEPYYRLGLVDEMQGNLRNAFASFTAAEQQDSHYHPASLKVAQYYLAGGQYDETRKRLATVLTEDPVNAEAHALNAALLLREKNYDEAEKEGKLALSEDPNNIPAYSALTGLYSALDNSDKAIATVNQGITHNPDSLALLMLRVLIYEKMNDLPKVAESYQGLFKVKPKDISYRISLASLYVKAGKLDEAEATLREGVSALPNDWDMKHALVMFLSEYRSLDAAENEIKSIIAAYPKNEDPNFWLADLYTSHNDIDKAADILNKIVSNGQSEPSALNAQALLARIDIKRGNKDTAQKLIAKVLEKAPDNRDALYLRASMEFEGGYYQTAVSDLRNIIRNAPNDQNALQLLSETLLIQGHIDLAADSMQKLTEINPQNMSAHVRLAQMVRMQGDKKRSMELISFATTTFPTYAPGWETAARFAIDSQEWLPAEEAIRQLDKLDGQHPTAEFLEGQILYDNGKDEEALSKFMSVINTDPTSPLAEHALSAYVQIESKLKQLDKATVYLESLKSDSPYVLTMLGKCYAMRGKLDESGAAYDQALANKPKFVDPYIDRAKLYLGEKKPEDAINVLKSGAINIPGDISIPLMEADISQHAGKFQDAIQLYSDILARDPSQDLAANNVAELIADYQFQDPTALEKARQIADRFAGSDNPTLLDTLAWVYYRQGNFPMAQTLIDRALTQSQGKELPAQFHFHYGAILIKNGKIDHAKEELKKAVANGSQYPGVEEAQKALNSL